MSSSIGGNWPPAPGSNDRIRGLYPELLTNQQQTDSFMSQLEGIELQDNEIRLSIRAFSHRSQLGALACGTLSIEAIVPLIGYDITDTHLVWLGHNNPEREMSAAHVEQHLATLEEVFDEPSHPTLQPTNTTLWRVHDQHRRDVPDELCESFSDLFEPFGYDQNDTVVLLQNPSNDIAYLRHQGKIVSCSMVEHQEVQLENAPAVHLAEITEASTLPGYRGNGYYEAVSGWIGHETASSEQAPHVLYGESNLAMYGVLKAARRNGRTFAHHTAADYGITDPRFGILPQNVAVSDNVEDRRYNDFAVSYITDRRSA